MAEQHSAEGRITKLEQGFTLLSEKMKGLSDDLSSFVQEQREFRQEWRKTKEAEASSAIERAKAEASARRITLPQFIAMAASIVTATAVVFGGLMWVINSVAGGVRSDVLAQHAQTGLQIRTATEALIAMQASQQNLQRDIAADRVKLGLVEQSAANSARLVQAMESYDAHMARHDEQIRAIQQALREASARQQRPP